MYCQHCHTTLPQNAAFCMRCGAQWVTSPPQNQVVQQPFPSQVPFPPQGPIIQQDFPTQPSSAAPSQLMPQPSPSQALFAQGQVAQHPFPAQIAYPSQSQSTQQPSSLQAFDPTQVPAAQQSFSSSHATVSWAPHQHEPWSALVHDGKAPEHTETEKHEAQGEHGHKEEEETHDNERLLVFSDGIIAFALTIAAITIKIPTSAEELMANSGPIFLRSFMYIVAFIIVASAWNDHHSIFHHIKRNNILLVILNFFYLVGIVMFPIGLFFLEFGIELYNVKQAALAQQQLLFGSGVFLISQIAVGLALFFMWFYSRGRSHLLGNEIEPRFISYMNKRLLAKPAMLIFVLASIAAIIQFPSMTIDFVIAIAIPVVWIAVNIYLKFARRGIDTSVGSDDTNRIQLFSDAVIGIAVTLAVAQIEFPSLGEDGANAAEAVNSQWPLLHAFLIGVVIMGFYWLFHYHLFRFIKRHDGWLIFLNCLFLLEVVLMIFPVNIVVDYHTSNKNTLLFDFSYLLFGFWELMTSLTLLIMWRHASNKGHLFDANIPAFKIKRFNTVVIAQPIIFAMLTIMSLLIKINPIDYIITYLLLIGCVWFVSQRLIKKNGQLAFTH